MKPSLPRRRLIPKWRPVANTLQTSEAVSTGTRKPSLVLGVPEDLTRAVEQWRESKAPGMLGEVLSFSVHPELRDKVIAVGNEAIKSGATVTSVQTRLIRELSKEDDDNDQRLAVSDSEEGHDAFPFQAPIRRLRALLNAAPDNALALLDYAQLQAAVGKLKSAERALRTALSLAPNNRTIIRTAARYFVHAQRPDIAHQLIRRHPRTPHDPWLIASEIALADVVGADSSFLNKGKRLLQDDSRFSVAHLTELAGSIAMRELASGNLKRARDAQRQALLSPNDNVAAQAIDLQREFGVDLSAPQILRAISSSSEAQLLQAWMSVSPDGVEQHAKGWHAEEPFSSRPIQLLTTLYAYQGEFVRAERWIGAGLLTDPHDAGLLINLAFVQAKAQKIEEAQQTIRRVRTLHAADSEPFLRATEGLIAYQLQAFEIGNRLYEEAVVLFTRSREPGTAAYCRLNQAIAALAYNHPDAERKVASAKAALIATPNQDSAMLLKILQMPTIESAPAVEPRQRRLSQWLFDPIKNTLTERPGVTAVGAKGIILSEQPSTQKK